MENKTTGIDTIRKTIILYISLALFQSVYGEKCFHTVEDHTFTITCEGATMEDYLDDIFEMKIHIRDFKDNKGTFHINIKLHNCNLSHIDDWIYIPWEEYMQQVSELRITNSSINHIQSLNRFNELKILDLSSNDINDYAFLESMKSLTHLYLAHNNFSPDSSLFDYIRGSYALSVIDLSYSNLENFRMSFQTNIISCNLSHSNNLREIFLYSSDFYIQNLDLTDNRNLIACHLNYNDIGHLDLSNSYQDFTDILRDTKIYNKITLKDNYLPVLNETTLNLDFRCCESRSILGLSIDLSNTSLADISDGFFNEQLLNELNLSFNNLSKLEYPLFLESKLVNLNLSSSNISSLSPNVFSNLTVKTIDLSNNNLRWLDGTFSRAHTIKNIILSSNPIASITKSAFKKCRDLESLDLTNTYALYSGNVFATLPSLRNFDASFSKSLYTPEILNMNLSSLTIVNSRLDKLNSSSFKGFYKLERLTFVNSSSSGMSKNVFKGLYSLRYIDISGLSDLNIDPRIFKPLKYLEVLDLSNYNLRDLQNNLNTLKSLEILNLSSNVLQLEKDSFSGLRKLQVLCLTDNKLSSLPVGLFASLKKLTHLYLNKNYLSQLVPGIFSNLNSLEMLDLSHNQLTANSLHNIVPISVSNMKYLYLQNNYIRTQSRSNVDYYFSIIVNHPSLKRIDVNNNEWRCSILFYLLLLLRNNYISYLPDDPSYKETNIDGIRCTS
ncbi:uncharacterized protein LOC143191470 [Rhynchophorus ferrugineus]|uniref:uncharacterized protein LOC143191470 n=1 Tax=Rhynchophorus ferrugineus TaxID=354439 RepID=UPI003FCC9117